MRPLLSNRSRRDYSCARSFPCLESGGRVALAKGDIVVRGVFPKGKVGACDENVCAGEFSKMLERSWNAGARGAKDEGSNVLGQECGT